MARILAVDDSDQNLILIQLYLQPPEFELETARDGNEALELASRRDYDMILLDVVMPGMDGFEVCRRLQAQERTAAVPVILLTGRSRDMADKLHGFELGAVDYITKPVERSELIARIKVMLRLRATVGRLAHENLRLADRLEQALRAAGQAERSLQDHRELHALQHTADPLRVLIVDADGGVVDASEPVSPSLARQLAALQPPADARGVVTASETEGLRTYAVRAQGLRSGHYALICEDVTSRAPLERRIADRARVERVDTDDEAFGTGYRITGLVGQSNPLRELTRQVDRLRHGRSTVLIHGETGVGKELIARALHFDGPHAERPFIPIHCGAISKELIESELFGYEKGAFTGAQTSKQGLFSVADGGTIFLDEIAETSMDLQVKLLRVLQQGEVRPVGANHPHFVDVRIIAATNKDLYERVRTGAFREDLLFRLEVVTLEVPPLRERLDDLALLVQWFLQRMNELHERGERGVYGISEAALATLQSYAWPGNVRELENMIDRALALGASSVLQLEDFPPRIRGDARGPRLEPAPAPGPLSLEEARRRSERVAILQALQRHAGDKNAAARSLQMSRSTFYRRLRQLEIG
jgi:DNA-binding NtrC family response regulator